MRRQGWWLPLVALLFVTNWKLTSTLPVPDEELDTSTKLLGSSVVTSVSVVTRSSDNVADENSMRKSTADRMRVIPTKDLPGSPADLLRPDRFQFHTYNKEGNVVTTQMTEQQIHSLIATGGGHLPMEIHEPEKSGDIPAGGMKVSDVVQNVQKVLKGELNKPATVMTSIPTIPGHDNTEWSSILPAILGGESETAPVSESISPMPVDISEAPAGADETTVKSPEVEVPSSSTKLPVKEPAINGESSKKPASGISEKETHDEKPMIQVPVITVEQKLPSHQTEEDSRPVFQMLNTLSADKINAKNKTHVDDKSKPVEPTHVNQGQTEIIVKPVRVPVKQDFIKESIIKDSTVPVDKHSEMIKNNLNSVTPPNVAGVKKPLVKPESGIITAETILNLPESESSSMTVISETHSTSMKVSGHEEIPLREPSKPLIETVNPVRVSSETKKSEGVTEKMTLVSSADDKLEATSLKVEAPTMTEQSIEATTEPGLFAQGVSFFGNLPQTVSSIVSEFISSNKPSSDAKIPSKISQGVNESIGTNELGKINESTKSPVAQATIASIDDKVTSTKRPMNQEPVFQMMPDIIPDKKTPSHGSLPSAVSSIEHIIETLNDPTGSLSGTVAADHFMIHKIPENKLNMTRVNAETTKPTKIAEIQSSTNATPIKVENPVETSSSKPMEPLPTELADSLSSMISQISDVMPSVLPISDNAGLDTTEKKTASNVNAEEHTKDDVKIAEAQIISKTPETSTKKIQLSVQAMTEKPEALSTEESTSQDSTIIGTAGVKESMEKLKNVSSTGIPISEPLTTQSSKLDKPTMVKIDAPLVIKESTEVPVNRLEQPVAEKLEASDPESEKIKPEIDEVQASSDMITDKTIIQAIAQESLKTETPTKLPVIDASMEKISTDKSAMIVTNSASSTVSMISSEQTERPMKIQTDGPMIVQEPQKSENQKTEMPIKMETNENNTELPIVRIDITEGKPTQFTHVNKTQVNTNVENGGESPLVRIKLTDPVTVINNIIASANVDVSPPPIAALSLPETGSFPPNTIASGLIAGYPSSTTQSTSNANLPEENPSTTIESVVSLTETQIVNDSPIINVTGELKPSDVEVENTKVETAGIFDKPNKRINASEKIENSDTSILNDSSIVPTEIPLNRIDLTKVSDIVESTEKATTVKASSIMQTVAEKSKLEEMIGESTTSKSVEIESPTTVATNQKRPANHNTSAILVENVTAVVEETTMKSSALPNEEDPVNRIEILTPSIVRQTEAGDKLKEASKIIETTVSTSTESEITTGQPELMEVKIKNPEVRPSSTNLTKSEIPDIRIDVASSKIPEIPSKIQLTDLPIVETSVAPKRPVKNEVIQAFHTTQKPQSIATMQIPIESPQNNTETSSNVSLQANIVSNLEKTTAEPGKEEPKLEDASKKPANTSDESTLPEKIAESQISTTQQTEEIRIQVNDTAVLVTKRPISDTPSQKPEDIKNIPENQAIDEPTTPKITSITEDPYVKLGEKIQLPVPAKVSELSSSDVGVELDSSIKEDTISESIMETRIRLGEEQQAEKSKDDKSPAKLDEPRKPIKKNTDSDSSQMADKDLFTSSTSKKPIPINDKNSGNKEEDFKSQSSTKVDNTKPVSSNEPSNVSKIEEPIKVEMKPTKLPENNTPVRLITERPIPKPSKSPHKPTMNIKKDDALPRPTEDQWTLIPQQVYPSLTKTGGSHVKRPATTEESPIKLPQNDEKISSHERPSVSLDHSQSANGLDSSVKNLETDISYFANFCNELAFTFWTATSKGLSTARSLAVSPFGMTSMLAMVFLGARGPTSDQMNDILKLDDVASFNPHLVFQNVTDAVGLARNQGIANAAFVRELFVDRSKVRKLMPFYKEQAQQFYDGIVAEVNFATISDLVRRRTNLMIRKQTGGRIKDFVRTNTVPLRSPLAALSANVFQTDCNSSAASSDGRDGELYFAVSPAVRQRKLVPVPATVWRAGVLAGYETSLDATAIALGGIDKLVSTIFVIPGQQGHTAPGDTLDRLEQRLIKGAMHDDSWNKLLKVLISRPGLELQVPKFSHRSVINATAALKRMGLEELFSRHADLKGINGVATDLHLADVLQMNLFSTCGDENIISGRHHVEVYPGSPLRNARQFHEFEEQTDNGFTDYTSNEEGQGFDGLAVPYVSHRQTRSARQNDGTDKQRLKLDRPFLYFVRHNPTGLILHMGRFNPRLLP